MARNRILPIPLILLIPVVLLITVIVAGVYRFSLSDDEILAKFPSREVQSNSIILDVLNIKSSNPWTIQIPEQNAVSFIDDWDKELGYLIGQYDADSTRGKVLLPTEYIVQRQINQEPWIVAPMIVTTQGTGTFYYIGLFKFDALPSRVILLDSVFIGDRIKFHQLEWRDDTIIEASYLTHDVNQAMSEPPKQLNSVSLKRVGNSLHMQQG
ncbi:hypothetical protein [uncultured Vibrio sp.]|uniref:hypothetical protein n=1 Tax=uncultured Vibrio sp. TaxID=114054 RepID=UPI0029C6CCEF|nr:hypothetical protein [uncultured Vibrio sp.]